MSRMSYMEKLLDGVQVEWRALGEVAEIQRGRRLIKSELQEVGNYAVFQNSMTPLGYYHESNVKSDTTFIISAGAAGEIGYSNVDFWAADDVYYFLTPENLKSKFLYYFLLTQQTKLLAQVRRASVPRLSKTTFEKLQIPIPCPENPAKSLEIQAEIVRILDAFTELTAELIAELNAELAARKKQYNYYRDQLLSFEEGEVEWKTLGEVGEFIRGNGLQKKDFVESGFPAIHYGQIYTKYGLSAKKTFSYVSEEIARKLRKANKNDLLLATTSENDEDVVKPLAWLGEEAAISGDMMLFRHKQNVKYLAYFFQTTVFQEQKGKYITGTKVRRVSSGDLAKIRIPLPSLTEQERIVAILDKFDALTNSISEGLPREIALRQQQYEYYRDLLFSFPKPEQAEA
jgi:type I restriction enzyme S subunit